MRYIVAILFCAMSLSLFAGRGAGQDISLAASQMGASQKTGAPADARFEIIQTNSNIRTTLKLDKFTGNVYELIKNKDLVRAKDEEYAWAMVKRLSHPLDKTESTNEVNYQITTSSVGVRYTFLININTGASWKLAPDPDREQSYWHPIKTQ
ncbi:MAG TPA: hypothetical protein VF735_09820 [Pyrinomonadaceae bacterium]|jgi:hypothetical protein